MSNKMNTHVIIRKLSRFISIALILLITAFSLANCAPYADEADTTAPDRELLDKLVGNTGDSTESDNTQETPDTTKKTVDTERSPSQTTDEPKETAEIPAETSKTPEDTTEKPVQTNEPDSGNQNLVWIPTKGGKKYHSKSSCSNMDGPIQVTLEEAIDQGFTSCKRCH